MISYSWTRSRLSASLQFACGSFLSGGKWLERPRRLRPGPASRPRSPQLSSLSSACAATAAGLPAALAARCRCWPSPGSLYRGLGSLGCLPGGLHRQLWRVKDPLDLITARPRCAHRAGAKSNCFCKRHDARPKVTTRPTCQLSMRSTVKSLRSSGFSLRILNAS